jgi:hypothetical protein
MAAVTPSVVVGVKRPRSPTTGFRDHLASAALSAALTECELPRSVREQLVVAARDTTLKVVWPTAFYSARRAWEEILKRKDSGLEEQLLPVLLRSGLREDLNSIDVHGYTALTRAFRYSAHAGIALLREHQRDAVNCPLDFDCSAKSAFLCAILRFRAEVDESHWPWLIYIAKHSSAESLNMRVIATAPHMRVFNLVVTAYDLYTTEVLVHTLTHPDVSPDDESKLLLLDGKSNVWAHGALGSCRVVQPTHTEAEWMSSQEFLWRRYGHAALDAIWLLNQAQVRHSAYRARVIDATRTALDSGLPVTDLRALVALYLPQPLLSPLPIYCSSRLSVESHFFVCCLCLWGQDGGCSCSRGHHDNGKGRHQTSTRRDSGSPPEFETLWLPIGYGAVLGRCRGKSHSVVPVATGVATFGARWLAIDRQVI